MFDRMPKRKGTTGLLRAFGFRCCCWNRDWSAVKIAVNPPRLLRVYRAVLRYVLLSATKHSPINLAPMGAVTPQSRLWRDEE